VALTHLSECFVSHKKLIETEVTLLRFLLPSSVLSSPKLNAG
jgi:hypothetical protein